METQDADRRGMRRKHEHDADRQRLHDERVAPAEPCAEQEDDDGDEHGRGERAGAVEQRREADEAGECRRVPAMGVRHAVADHDLPGLEAGEAGHRLAGAEGQRELPEALRPQRAGDDR